MSHVVAPGPATRSLPGQGLACNDTEHGARAEGGRPSFFSMAVATAGSELAAFIRERGVAILGEWEARARQLSPARELSSAALRDHLPRVIERIATLAESAGGAPIESHPEPAEH